MITGIKHKALLIGTLAVSILICGCGVKKDSDDKAMLVIGDNITEVTSDGQEDLLDVSNNKATYWAALSFSNLRTEYLLFQILQAFRFCFLPIDHMLCLTLFH